MNQEKIFKTLLAPIVSEKITKLTSSNNQYAFKVSNDSNKKDIKNAVEFLFNVNVVKVRTYNLKGSSRIFKGRKGKTKNWKKAIIRLNSGQMIDVTGN